MVFQRMLFAVLTRLLFFSNTETTQPGNVPMDMTTAPITPTVVNMPYIIMSSTVAMGSLPSVVPPAVDASSLYQNQVSHSVPSFSSNRTSLPRIEPRPVLPSYNGEYCGMNLEGALQRPGVFFLIVLIFTVLIEQNFLGQFYLLIMVSIVA